MLYNVSEIDKHVGKLDRAISCDFEGLPIANLGWRQDMMCRARERRPIGPAHNHDKEQHHLQ